MTATEREVSRISRVMSYALRIELACHLSHISIYTPLATHYLPQTTSHKLLRRLNERPST